MKSIAWGLLALAALGVAWSTFALRPRLPAAERGRRLAERTGCFGCHGPGGRLARSNPGSLKGYLPSWDGEDFPELVTSRTEFEQWVEQGVARRLERNPIARTFLRRAALHMPRYERHLEEGDLEAL